MAVRRISKFERWLGALAGSFLFLLFWEFMGSVFLAAMFPPIHDIIVTGIDLILHDIEFRKSVVYSVSNVYIGTGIAFAGSVVIASGMSLSRHAESILWLPVDILRNISALALYPLFIVLFGLGRDAHIAIIVWNTWANVLLVTYKALLSVSPDVLEAAQLDGATNFQLFQYMKVPLVMPDVLLSVRVSFGLGWFAILVSEMLGGTTGLGYMIMTYSNAFDFPRMYATIIVTSLSGLVMSLFWAKLTGLILDRIL